MVFEVYITDLYGSVLTWTDETDTVQSQIRQFTNLSVELKMSEDRSASVTLSLHHPAVEKLIMVAGEHRVACLGRMIRIRYRGTTIFWGPVVTPKFSVQNATVELHCQGPAFKLKHRQLNYSDPIVSPDGAPETGDTVKNPSDHTTMKAIVEAANDTPGQYALNIPDIGIQVVNVDGRDAPSAFFTEIERGDNNWDTLVEVAGSPYGGEFEIVPYDPDDDEIPFDTTMRPVE